MAVAARGVAPRGARVEGVWGWRGVGVGAGAVVPTRGPNGMGA